MRTIAITLGLRENYETLWSNGIKLNAIYIAKLLKNSNLFNVIFVNTTSKNITKFGWDTNEFPTYHISEKINDIDFLLSIGGQINQEQTNILKRKKVPIVPYACGNEYVIRMENMLFGGNISGTIWANPDYDEIWVVPQNYEHNYYFFKQMHGINDIKSVPFIWDSFILDDMNKNNNGAFDYKIRDKAKTIAVMEANKNVLKFCMYPMLIANGAYKKRPDLIKKMYVNNTEDLRTNNIFIQYVNHLDIQKAGITSYENRHQTNEFLANYADVIISHQWDNPLNYFYMDIAHFGFPVLHNAHMCKDIGYYYDRFDGDEAENKLLWILENHDKNIDEYKEKNKKELYKFRASNEKNIEYYVNAINRLIG